MMQSTSINKQQPWEPADATDAIRLLARGKVDLARTKHALDQMAERGLIISDVLHVLKNGFVYETPESATQPNCFKYKVECSTPEGPRTVRVVVIPGVTPPILKIVTVMWKDEAAQRP